MDDRLVTELNKLTGEKFTDKDLVLVKEQGARSMVYSVANRYAIKTRGIDYSEEKKALECLKNMSFVPKIYGFNDQSQTIYMEWLSGDSLFEYIHLNNKIPETFLNKYYDMKVQMYGKMCEDYDNKWSELYWIDGEIKKVDYGQVVVSPRQNNLEDFYRNLTERIKNELQQLIDNDESTWNMITNKFLINGVSSEIVKSYRNKFIA